MRGYNPALVAYRAIDLDKIPTEMEQKPSGGLLAPKKSMDKPSDLDKQPAMRTIAHMKILRKRREQINGS